MVCCLCTGFLLFLAHFVALVLYFRYTTGKYKIKKRLDGRTYIVTGATAGVGKATTYRLAQNGAKVYMFVRNVAKAEKVKDQLVKKSFNNDIHIVQCDLADFESVKKAAQEFLAKGEKIDGLINNAGVMFQWGSKSVTKDGHEEQIQGNHLGHFLLTNLLLDKLKESKARIVNLSSIAGLLHRNFGSTKDFDPRDLDFQRRPYVGRDAYGCSKLANILFTKELARRLYGTGVTVNCCHPGAVDTELLRIFPNWVRNYAVPLMVTLAFMKSADQGAMTSLYLATSDDVKNISGAYFADCVPGQPSLQGLDDHLATELWDESEKIVKEFM